MNIYIYQLVNKDYENFKLIANVYNFDEQIISFTKNNRLLTNLPQIKTLLYLMEKCQSFGFNLYESQIRRLIKNQRLNYFVLKTLYKEEDLNSKLQEFLSNIMTIVYQENKNVLLTSNEKVCKTFLILKDVLDNNKLATNKHCLNEFVRYIYLNKINVQLIGIAENKQVLLNINEIIG